MTKYQNTHYLLWKIVMVSLLMLMSCKLIAQGQGTDASVSKQLDAIENLLGSDDAKATQELAKLERDFDQLAVSHQIRYLLLQTEVSIEMGDYKNAKEYSTQGIALAKESPVPSKHISELHYGRGFTFESMSNLEKAYEDYQLGLEAAQSLREDELIAQGLINLGAISYMQFRYDDSLTMLSEAYTISKRLEDHEISGYVTNELGILYSLINETDQALVYYRQSYDHYVAANKKSYVLNAIRNIGTFYINQGNYQEAIPFYKEALLDISDQSNPEVLLTIYSNLAYSFVQLEEIDEESARYYLNLAEQMIPKVQSRAAEETFVRDKAYVLKGLKDYEGALALAIQYEKMAQSNETAIGIFGKVDIANLRQRIYFEQKDFEKAYQYQGLLYDHIKTVHELQRSETLDNLRLRYESEQADIAQKILQQQQSIDEITLKDQKRAHKNKQFMLSLAAVFTLLFAWFLLKILAHKKRLLIISRTDELTGVANRRQLMQLGNEFFKQTKNDGLGLSVLMIDVDEFKHINDKYGHNKGDEVLIKLANIGKNMMRQSDIFGRLGGEEFVALLPTASQAHAIDIGERFMQALRNEQWQLEQGKSVTVSIGVASISEQDKKIDDLIKRADNKLYQAKHDGRNRICA